ncbi:MAG: HD domain-containing protein [Chloroflexi bacterium]|nr:HD domain-containing protein [Chloroflexota bacterium]
MNPFDWQPGFETFIATQFTRNSADPAHDLAHIHRVVRNAITLAAPEQADLAIVLPAAWLHDCVIIPKDSPRRSQSSRLAAETAVSYLQSIAYPGHYLDAIAHAIAAHSFSAGIPPRTVEAKVVQDADRLDAIGAIGIARCFMVGGVMGRILYQESDPFCAEREPDDRVSTVDHFYTKLFTLLNTMQTTAGRAEAERRTQFMQTFLEQLGKEIT